MLLLPEVLEHYATHPCSIMTIKYHEFPIDDTSFNVLVEVHQVRIRRPHVEGLSRGTSKVKN